MMRATFLNGYGGNDMLATGELPDPIAGPDEAIVSVKAVGVNPVEPAMRAGLFHAAFPFAFPQIMGFDAAGVVVSAPEGSGFVVGDEVYSRLSSQKQGGYAERVATQVGLLAHKPKSLDFAGAASLPTVALTTWQAFVERAELKAGDHILIQAGAGGVGSFAIQLAKHMGAIVTATGSAANQQWMKDLGADHTIDYNSQRFEDGGPYDVVYDGVCGPLTARGINSVKPGGRYVGLVRMADARAYRDMGLPAAAAEGAAAGVKPFVEQAEARGATFHGILTRPDAKQLAEIGRIVDAGAIKATVTQTFDLADVAKAYDALSTGRTRGKIVVNI